MKSIWAHCLVKNEARFVWYSVMSVIKHVDKVLLWDTGSTDGTVEIIKELKKKRSQKIDLCLLGDVTPEEFTGVRQEMLEATKSDWFIIVDGDDIWWDSSIKKLVKKIHDTKNKAESIVVPAINSVGDIYHYQEEAAGRYKIAGRKGHLGLKAINRKIPGLASSKPHGTWGWVDGFGKMIQNRGSKKISFLSAPYLHTTLLPRASNREEDLKVPKRAQKLKHEIGIPLALDYFYPEVFFRPRAKLVPSVWETMSTPFWARSFLETPFRRLKRRLITSKSGY